MTFLDIEKCLKCGFRDGEGRCHAKPPEPQAPGLDPEFPEVEADDWCGFFRGERPEETE